MSNGSSRRFFRLSFILGTLFPEFNRRAFSLDDAFNIAQLYGFRIVKTQDIKSAASAIFNDEKIIFYNPKEKSEPVLTLILLHEILHHCLGHIDQIVDYNGRLIRKGGILPSLEEQAVDVISRIMLCPLRSAIEEPNFRHKKLPYDMRHMQAEAERFKKFPYAVDLTDEELDDWTSIRAWIYNTIIKECQKYHCCKPDLDCLKCPAGRVFFKE